VCVYTHTQTHTRTYTHIHTHTHTHTADEEQEEEEEEKMGEERRVVGDRGLVERVELVFCLERVGAHVHVQGRRGANVSQKSSRARLYIGKTFHPLLTPYFTYVTSLIAPELC